MKKLFASILLLNAILAHAQNLVPNPGFETYSTIPDYHGEYYYATGWNNCNGGGSPDYFSTLGSGQANLPNDYLGTLYPHGGNACMGACLLYYYPNYREYIDIQLTSPMTVGKTYDVSFYITNGVTDGVNMGGGVNQVSVAFTPNSLTQGGFLPINFKPQYTYGGTLYNKSWQLISFQFTADSAYRFITLGNFKYDSLTTYQQFDQCNAWGAYYFYDDFNIQESGIPPVAGFSTSDTVLCENSCINFNNLSTHATSWHWLFPGANPSSDTTFNPHNICYPDSGKYDVTLVATNNTGNDTLLLHDYITVKPAPPTPAITQIGTTLYCSTDPTYSSYQWYLDSALIPGATDTSLAITQSGNYNVRVRNENGCSVAVGINIILGLQYYINDQFVFLSPNPSGKQFTAYGLQFTVSRIEILNALGEVCKRSEITNHKSEVETDVSELPSGIYFVRLTGDQRQWVGRFVKE